jgi:ribosome modulation factor
MANLSITAANVEKASDAGYETGIAGDTLTAGMSVYKDTTDSNKWKKALCAGTAAQAGSGGCGITLNAATAGQPVTVQTSGSLDVGATLTIGQIYVVSATAGLICPFTDLNTNNYVTLLGFASAADNLKILNYVTSVQATSDLA